MINLYAVGKLDHVAAGFAAVHDLVAIRDTAGVVSVNHGHFDVADALSAALIHFCNLLYAFSSQPVRQFGDGNHHRVMLLRDFHRVADVVEVAMGAEQDIQLLDVLLRFGTLGIPHDPRVHDDGLPRRCLDAEGCVA